MTHTQWLKEIGKFVSGLVAADLLMGLWLLTGGGSLPQSLFGLWITSQLAWLWVGFDAFVLLVLIHYAWNPKTLEPHASSRTLFFLIGLIMGVVTVIHFLRLVFGWSVVIGGWEAPMWLSWVGLIVAAYLCYTSFHFVDKHRKQ